MAEEFQAGICSGNWWINSPRGLPFMGGSSPCSMENTTSDHVGNIAYGYGSWMDMVDLKARSCKESNIANSVSDSSMTFQSSQKPPLAISDGGGSTILMDSALQMTGFGLSPSSSLSSEWNHALIPGSGRVESYESMMQQEDMNSGLNSGQVQKEWSPNSTSEDSSINAFKAINQDFSFDQQGINPINSSGNSIPTCQSLSTGFSMGNSATYGHPSTLVQSLFEPEPPQPQQGLFHCHPSANYSFSTTPNYGFNLNESSPSWPNIAPLLKSSLPKQEQSSLHFSNNTPLWNASATGDSVLASPHSQTLVQTLEKKPNNPSLAAKPNNEDARGPGSVGKKGIEPAFKRPRIETPSPLPTFKVRKEKLGDRITALQQLVSPFGKTDTASVLHEAIEYIKFLHDQVNVLSNPYMKNGNPIQNHQQVVDKSKDPEALRQDLRSRGLCLVPISSTFPVAHETTADFWTPTFGGNFR